jgi:hypothetical protein
MLVQGRRVVAGHINSNAAKDALSWKRQHSTDAPVPPKNVPVVAFFRSAFEQRQMENICPRWGAERT